MTTTPSTGERAQSAASTAADESKHVGQTAAQEAKNVAGEAAAQARNLADEAIAQVDEQSRTQRDRIVATLSSFSDDLDTMSARAENQGLASDVVRMVSERARRLSGRLDGREPREMLDDVRAFARRRPGTFLLGSLAAGVVAGRLLRGAKDAGGSPGSSGSTGSSAEAPGPAYDPVQTAVLVDEPIPATVMPPASAGGSIGEPVADPTAEPVAEPLGDQEYGAHRGLR